MWVMLTEIATQLEWLDENGELRLWTPDQWKDVFMRALNTALNEPQMLTRNQLTGIVSPRLRPLYNKGFVVEAGKRKEMG
jgi:hypothetical protein